MKQVNVSLGEASYSLLIGAEIIASLSTQLGKIIPSRKLIILTNPKLFRLYGNKLASGLRNFDLAWIKIPDGEKYKNLATVEVIYHQLLRLGVDRHSALVAFGGGVIGDIGGFVAATFLRGLPYIQIPTTLLAQVDSSVGGKTGVDLAEGKNLIGAFYQPKLVFIDTSFLSTLPLRELRCGLSEVVKYGCVWSEKLFRFVEENTEIILKKESKTLAEIIRQSVSIKAEVVSKDERESGLRAILNFGHTLGHAIEALGGYQGLKHGEAVSVGMVCAARLSRDWQLCSEHDTARVISLLKKLGLPVTAPSHPRSAYLKKLGADKKRLGDKINFVALKKIGRVELVLKKPVELLNCLPGEVA